MAEKVKAGGLRLVRAAEEAHVYLFQGFPSFAAVAGWAGTHQVLPLVFSALVARDNVVYRKMRGAPPTVLASVLVAAEDFSPVKLDARLGPLDQIEEANH